MLAPAWEQTSVPPVRVKSLGAPSNPQLTTCSRSSIGSEDR